MIARYVDRDLALQWPVVPTRPAGWIVGAPPDHPFRDINTAAGQRCIITQLNRPQRSHRPECEHATQCTQADELPFMPSRAYRPKARAALAARYVADRSAARTTCSAEPSHGAATDQRNGDNSNWRNNYPERDFDVA